MQQCVDTLNLNIRENLTYSQKDFVTEGSETYKGFVLDNILHSDAEGDIHYSVYIPKDYDGSEKYALFFTLPGYSGGETMSRVMGMRPDLYTAYLQCSSQWDGAWC